MQHEVLVLNRLWQAVHICSTRRAVALLWLDHAQVVHEENGQFYIFNFSDWCEFAEPDDRSEMLCSISFSMQVPRIILLKVFDRFPRKEIKLSRENVFARDSYTCQYCLQAFERKHLTIDHVMPRQRGGVTKWTNVVTSCRRCNNRKGNYTPAEAQMPLKKEPQKPAWRPFAHFRPPVRQHHSWRHFLDVNAWEEQLQAR